MRKIRNSAAGAQTDFQKLMQKFIDGNSIRFEKFAEIWRENKFSLIFMGRENVKELREFVEECYRIVLGYLTPSNSFHKKVGALYMLYGLHMKQNLQPKAKIRLMMSHFKDVKALLDIALREKHFDVAYIIHFLMSKFHFVAKPTMLGPRTSVMCDLETEIIGTRLEDVTSSLNNFLEGGILEQISLLHNEYQKSKESQPVQSIQTLEMVEEDTAENFQRKLQNLLNKYTEQPVVPQEASSQSDDEWLPSSSLRARLREKQYTAVASVKRSRRHRAVQLDDSSSSPTKKDVQKKRGRPPKKRKELEPFSMDDEEKVDDPSDAESEVHYDSGRIKKARRGRH